MNQQLAGLASLLVELTGTYETAQHWVITTLGSTGRDVTAGLGLMGDRAHTWRGACHSAGLADSNGKVNAVAAAELIVLLDALSAFPTPQAAAVASLPMVFTVPPEARSFVPPAQNLGHLVTDTIALAQKTLHVGGPFWNAPGWDVLKSSLVPALAERNVEVFLYLHPHDDEFASIAQQIIDEAASHGPLHPRWWRASEASLMHAKFVIADGERGYLGSANLTSYGLTHHLELGVALASDQAQSLVSFLAGLEEAGFFRTAC